MEANMIFKTISFYDIKSRHGLPKAELQRYWANARLHKVIVILNIITIIMIIIVGSDLQQVNGPPPFMRCFSVRAG